MKALIIAEDFRKDQYILKPIFSRLLHQLGAKNVKVEVCRDPLLGGVGEALKLERIKDIVQRYKGMINFFVLCVDRDGVRERRQRLDQIEAGLKCGPDFVAENAWEETETWVLAGLDLPSEWKWSDVRAEVQVKEIYFEQYAAMHGLVDLPGGGRKTLGEEASHRVKNIRRKCARKTLTLLQNGCKCMFCPVRWLPMVWLPLTYRRLIETSCSALVGIGLVCNC